MSKPTEATRQAVYLRDGYRCAACGRPEALTFQHRRAVQMGGSKIPPPPIDGLTLCSICNEGCESEMQTQALASGWKVRKWVTCPERVPVYVAHELSWYQLEGTIRIRISTAVAMEMGCSVYGDQWMQWRTRTAA